MPFVIDSNELDYVTQIKLLGVIIDNSLSFKAHIQEICRKVNAKVSILRRIRKLIPSDIMIKLYKAFILPHFEYASPLFIGLSMGLSAKLESTNAFALRTLLNYSRSTACLRRATENRTYQKLGTSTHRASIHTYIHTLLGFPKRKAFQNLLQYKK